MRDLNIGVPDETLLRDIKDELVEVKEKVKDNTSVLDEVVGELEKIAFGTGLILGDPDIIEEVEDG